MSTRRRTLDAARMCGERLSHLRAFFHGSMRIEQRIDCDQASAAVRTAMAQSDQLSRSPLQLKGQPRRGEENQGPAIFNSRPRFGFQARSRPVSPRAPGVDPETETVTGCVERYAPLLPCSRRSGWNIDRKNKSRRTMRAARISFGTEGPMTCTVPQHLGDRRRLEGAKPRKNPEPFCERS